MQNDTELQTKIYTPSIDYWSKKIEAVCRAAHVITKSIKDIEPIRTGIRQTSLDLTNVLYGVIEGVTDNAHYSIKNSPALYDALKEVQVHVRKLRALVSIASLSKLISEGNAELFTRYLDIMITEIAELHTDLLKEEKLQSSLFFFGELPAAKVSVDLNPFSREEQKVADENIVKKYLQNAHTSPAKNIKKSIHPVLRNITKQSSEPSHKMEDRKQKIVELIKDKNSVSIKDISEHLKDISSKTIQRDLNSLIDEHTIVRKGDRRWSVYELI